MVRAGQGVSVLQAGRPVGEERGPGSVSLAYRFGARGDWGHGHWGRVPRQTD